MTSGIIGQIKVTVLCIASKNNSKMLSKNINGEIVNKLKWQLLLLRVVQQRKCPDSGTLSVLLRRI